MNIRAIYAHYLRGDTKVAENALQKIARNRDMELEDLLTELHDTFGDDPDAINTATIQSDEPTNASFSYYIDGKADKILLFAVVSTAVGWKRFLELQILRGRTANRRFTFNGLTTSELVYCREMIEYYYKAWHETMHKNALRFNGASFSTTAQLLGRSNVIHMKVVLGAVLSFIQINNIVPDDMAKATNVKTVRHEVINLTDLEVNAVPRLVPAKRRTGQRIRGELTCQTTQS